MSKMLCLTPIKHISGLWEQLSSCTEILYYPLATKEKAQKIIDDEKPSVLFVNPNSMTFRLDKSVLNNSISVVCTASTGLNHIDVDYCKLSDIKVISLTNDYEVINKVSSTAELALGLTLSLIRNIPMAINAAREFNWNYMPFIGRQMAGLNVGVIGFGRLGKMYANYCISLKSKVKVCDPHVTSSCHSNVDLRTLLSESDIISLHVHLNDETYRMINAETLKYVEGCYLINTSRGDIVDENAVIEALNDKRLLGYATDVVSDELGSIKNSELIKRSNDLNILITPHIGGMTIEAQQIAYCAAADKLLNWLGDKK